MLVEFIVRSVKRNLTDKVSFPRHINFTGTIRRPSVAQCDRLVFDLHRKIPFCQNGRHHLSQNHIAAETGKHQGRKKKCRRVFFHVNRHLLNVYCYYHPEETART